MLIHSSKAFRNPKPIRVAYNCIKQIKSKFKIVVIHVIK